SRWPCAPWPAPRAATCRARAPPRVVRRSPRAAGPARRAASRPPPGPPHGRARRGPGAAPPRGPARRPPRSPPRRGPRRWPPPPAGQTHDQDARRRPRRRPVRGRWAGRPLACDKCRIGAGVPARTGRPVLLGAPASGRVGPERPRGNVGPGPYRAGVPVYHQETLDALFDDPRERTLYATTFVVVDLETTGGAPDGRGITEIGAVKIRSGEELGEFATLVNPGGPIPPYITVLTGITEAMVAPAPPIESVLPSFLEF